MVISPPFLPPINADSTKEDPLMEALDKMTDSSGLYPVAFDRRWHTGLHLVPWNDRSLPVRAIADGEVVAYRVCQHPIADTAGNKNTNAGFVLLKHTTETGENRTLTFYSLYMHLLDLNTMTHDGMQPPPIDEPHSMPEWLRWDSGGPVSGEGKKVRRKDILGYTGQCQDRWQLHFEIFMAPEDFDAYFGETQLGNQEVATPRGGDCWGHSYYVIPANQNFHAQPRGVEADKLRGIKFPAKQSGQNEHPLYVEVYFQKGDKYTNVWSVAADGSRTLLTDEPAVESEFEYDMYKRASALYPTCPSDGYEMLRFGRILSKPETLPPAPDQETSTAPNLRKTWYCIPFANGQQGYIDISKPAITRLSDADFPFFAGWRKIQASTAPVDQNGLWDLDKLKGVVRAAVGDVELPGTDLMGEPQTSQQKSDAMRYYVIDPDHEPVRKLLRGFICEAPSEWDSANLDACYRHLLNEGEHFECRQDAYNRFLDFVRKLHFWDKTGLPAGGKVWFFHPLAFIRHFRRCGWLSKDELSQIYAESKYASVGKTGAEYKERYRIDLNKVLRKYSLNNSMRGSHFFGQCAVESFYMMVVRESSTPIANAIKKNHPSIMPELNGYLRSPPANEADVAYFKKLYEGRLNLANTDGGDGVKFRGRGFKKLTGRFNYSEYWVYRGWLDAKSYDHAWFANKKNGKPLPGPQINNPEIAGNDTYACVDTAGFFCVRYLVARVSDRGVEREISGAVTKIVNRYDTASPPLRWKETQDANNILGDFA